MNITPNVGITGTPVIDATTTTFNSNPTLYFVSRSVDGNKQYHQRLHAIDVTSGAELFGGPVEITTPPGSSITFDPLYQNQGAGLVLTHDSSSNPQIYIAWGSHCDSGTYRGWVMKYSVIQGILSTIPTAYFVDMGLKSTRGGIWQSGGALAADNDTNGNLFFAAGNGSYNGISNFGQSIIKLSSTLHVSDWYTPNEWKCLNGITGNANCASDQDLGSGGVVLFNVPGGVPELLAAGKQGEIYVIYQSNLCHLDPAPVPTNYSPPPTCTTGPPGGSDIAQCFPGFLRTNPTASEIGSWGTPAFWNSTLFTVGSADVLRAFSLSTTNIGTLLTTPAVTSNPTFFSYPGASPAISWNGADPSTGIVWVLQTSGYRVPKAAVLYAYSAVPTTSGTLTKLFQSSSGPGAVKFVVPTIANGKVFVVGQGFSGTGTEGQLYVYGLCPCN